MKTVIAAIAAALGWLVSMGMVVLLSSGVMTAPRLGGLIIGAILGISAVIYVHRSCANEDRRRFVLLGQIALKCVIILGFIGFFVSPSPLGTLVKVSAVSGAFAMMGALFAHMTCTVISDQRTVGK